jgi:DNA polymerase III gamma/tau subunit
MVLGQTGYKPMAGPIKFYLFDECHKLLDDSQNALLRKLEHPEPHCYFALCTTRPEKLIETIRNRCTTFQVKSLPSFQVVKRLKEVLELEGVKDYPSYLLKEIAIVSAGSMRASLKLLDQVIDITDDEIALKIIQAALVSEATLKEICQLLLEESSHKWPQMAKLLKFIGDDDQESMRAGILNFLTTVLLNRKQDDRLAEMIGIFNENTFDTGKRGGIVYQLYLACKL